MISRALRSEWGRPTTIGVDYTPPENPSEFATVHIGVYRTGLAGETLLLSEREARVLLLGLSEAVLSDSDGSPKGGDKGTLGSVHDSAGPQDIARD